MSPIEDPSFAARRHEIRERELADAGRAERAEYIKPLVMVVFGVGAVLTWNTLAPGMPAGLIAGMVYLVVLVVSLIFGVAGLWVCCKLWLGGAGPFGLGVVRLAGVYGVTDLVGKLTETLSFMSFFIQAVVYVCLLAWLFELELMESIIVAIVTFLLKVMTAFVLALTIGTMLA